jgi:hypothetical protein
MQLPKEKMFDKSGQWIHLESFDDFDNGLSDLIDLWSSTSKTATQSLKESALAHFKEDLEAAVLKWIDNKARSKKYASIGEELAEFEAVLKEASDVSLDAANTEPAASARSKKKD